MAREKQYVFSARTTEEGLKLLIGVKDQLKLSWDEMVIDAVCSQYRLDKTTMALPKKERPAKEAQNVVEPPPTEQAPEERPTNGGPQNPVEPASEEAPTEQPTPMETKSTPKRSHHKKAAK